MTEAQQCETGSYVNLMNSSTQLLVNPIIGLQPMLHIKKRQTTFGQDQV